MFQKSSLHPDLRPVFSATTASGIRRMLQKKTYYDSLFNNGKVNWEKITFPFTLNQVKRFEKQNPTIGLTIICYDENRNFDKQNWEEKGHQSVDDVIHHVVGNKISSDEDAMKTNVIENIHVRAKKLLKQVRSKCYTLHTNKENRQTRIDLLLYLGKERNHFMFIKNLHALLYRTQNRVRNQICRFCLQAFTEYTISEHTRYCAELGLQKTNFSRHQWLKFVHFQRTIKIPNIVFADFESILEEIECLNMTETKRLNQHKAGAYSWICVDDNHQIFEHVVYHAIEINENVAQKMLKELIDLSQKLSVEVSAAEEKAKTLMIMTPEQEAQLKDHSFRRSQRCFFCHKGFGPNDIVHRHHCHRTFKFEGLAHSYCNMKAIQKENELVVIFHNFKGYDSKLILEAVNKDLIQNVEVIPSSSEKFACVIVKAQGQIIRFIDSYAFFNTNLEALGNTLDQTDFKLTKTVFSHLSDDELKLLHGKGIYPYSYMAFVERYNETCLPSKECFKNDLTGDDITPEQYSHAQNVWNTLKIETMGQYTNAYCLLDTAILGDCFLRLRDVMYESYGLDICHYFSLPMLVTGGAENKGLM